MADTREKLIEILRVPIYPHLDADPAEVVADYLLDNGVTLLPCKVGQKIWIVYSPKRPANPKDKGKWFMEQDGVQRIILGAKGWSIETWNMGTIPGKEIGKKLFFTCEEAEVVLQNRQRGIDYEQT